jgi:hypothetical protein
MSIQNPLAPFVAIGVGFVVWPVYAKLFQWAALAAYWFLSLCWDAGQWLAGVIL